MPVITPDRRGGEFQVSEEELERAATVIKGGGLVAFPTETFYGLAVDPFNKEALVRLFDLKKRPRDKPVLLLIDKVERLDDLVAEIPEQYLGLIEKFWPGPLTLVFPGTPKLAPLVKDPAGTVGIRVSSHPLAGRLAQMTGGAVTGTSANPTGFPAAISASQVEEMFPAGIDCIIDGGRVAGGVGSTIIGMDAGNLNLIRAGAIPIEDIEHALASD